MLLTYTHAYRHTHTHTLSLSHTHTHTHKLTQATHHESNNHYHHVAGYQMGLLVSGVCLAVHNDLNVDDVKAALTARKRWVWLSLCPCERV